MVSDSPTEWLKSSPARPKSVHPTRDCFDRPQCNEGTLEKPCQVQDHRPDQYTILLALTTTSKQERLIASVLRQGFKNQPEQRGPNTRFRHSSHGREHRSRTWRRLQTTRALSDNCCSVELYTGWYTRRVYGRTNRHAQNATSRTLVRFEPASSGAGGSTLLRCVVLPGRYGSINARRYRKC